MDHSARTSALQTAKSLIGAHGIVAHMNKYNRDILAREVVPDTHGLRYDFQLDPARDPWAGGNPSCAIAVSYTGDPKGARITEDGSSVVDQHLRVTVSASASDMDARTLRQRESMVSMLGMLCEMLEASLPKVATSIMYTGPELAEKKKRDTEQLVGHQVVTHLGWNCLKGLRTDGTAKTFRLTHGYAGYGTEYPDPGTYRFRHVRATDKRGRVKDVAHYHVSVFTPHSGDSCTSCSIRRVRPEDSTP